MARIKVLVREVISKSFGRGFFIEVDYGDGDKHIKGPMIESEKDRLLAALKDGQPPSAVLIENPQEDDRRQNVYTGYAVLTMVPVAVVVIAMLLANC